MRLHRVVVMMLLLVLAWSCKKDEENPIVEIPPRPLNEVSVENEADIQAFLKTHFYNYEEFANPPADFNFKIKIDTLAGENADKIPLSEQIQSEKIKISPSDLDLEDQAGTEQNLYYLVAREGAGGSPTVGDSTYLKYEGSLLDGTLFDGNSSYTWQYLPFYLRGYAKGISHFRTGDDILVNNDGTTSITNSGIGLIIMPSALGYYDAGTGVTAPYSNLMFQIDAGLYVENTDYDQDGIPSILEDLNKDGILSNDNTDAEAEAKVYPPTYVPNHLDRDDDGDGTLTRDEIIINPDGTITFPDTNGNGIPDYLDKDTK